MAAESCPPRRRGPKAIQMALSAWTTPHRVSAWVRAGLLGAFQIRRPEMVRARNSGGQTIEKTLGGGCRGVGSSPSYWALISGLSAVGAFRRAITAEAI